MLPGLILSAVVPWIVTRFGGMLISRLLLQLGVSKVVAASASGVVEEIARKIAQGKQIEANEQAVWKAHVDQHYAKPAGSASEVGSAPGVPFRRV